MDKNGRRSNITVAGFIGQKTSKSGDRKELSKSKLGKIITMIGLRGVGWAKDRQEQKG